MCFYFRLTDKLAHASYKLT